MNEEYIEKHLARNVPLDFGECCERVRRGLAPAVNRFRRREDRKSVEFDRYFKGMINILIDGDVSPDLDKKLARRFLKFRSVSRQFKKQLILASLLNPFMKAFSC